MKIIFEETVEWNDYRWYKGVDYDVDGEANEYAGWLFDKTSDEIEDARKIFKRDFIAFAKSEGAKLVK